MNVDTAVERIPVTLINEYSSTLSLSRHALPMLLDVLKLRGRAWRGDYYIAPQPRTVVEPSVGRSWAA